MYKKAIIKINGSELKTEIADSFWKKAKGLAGKKVINENEGMIFLFSKPKAQIFWMLGMKFPIDIIWILNNQIVGIENNALPIRWNQLWSIKLYKSPKSVNMVLEVKGGIAEKNNWKIGDKVEISKF